MARATRRDSGEWSSSTRAIGSFTTTLGAKMAQATTSASTGNQVTIARSHGWDRKYSISRRQAPRTPARNTASAPRDQHGHSGAHSCDRSDGARAHLEGLDVVAARLPR